MAEIGVDKNLRFKVKETSPILELKGSTIIETDKSLIKGSVFEGNLSTRVVNLNGEKSPFKLIKIKDEKSLFVTPKVVSIFVSDFEGIEPPKEVETKGTALGEGKRKYKKPSKLMTYGLPLGGLGLGYYIAKKKQYEPKKMAGMMLFFGLLGFLPKYLMKK